MTKEIQCKLCRRIFIFSEAAQQQYERLGYQPPKKCPDCRKRLNAQACSPFYGLSEAFFQSVPYRRGRRQSHYAPRVMGKFY